MALDIGIIVTAVNNARNALRQAHSDVDKLGAKGTAAANKLRAIHVVLAGIATGGLAAFSKKIVETTGDLEALIFRLGVLEGGIVGAKERFAELLRTFGNVPVALDAIVDGFVRLRAAGLNSLDAMATIKSSVDAVAAFGGGTEELKRLSIGLQQVLGKGVLQMEELRQQIGEAVPSAMRILAREMGISVAELVHRVSRGMVDAQTAVTKLRIGFDKDFGGIAQALGSTTIKGALAQFQTNIKQAIAQAFIFDTTANVRTAALIRDVGEAIARLIKGIDNSTVEKFFGILTDIANVAIRVASALAPIAGLLFNITAAVTGMISSLPPGVLEAGIIAALLIGVASRGAVGQGVAVVAVVSMVLAKLQELGKVGASVVTGIMEATAYTGIAAWILFGPGGIAKLLAGFAVIFSNLDRLYDAVSIVGLRIQMATEGNALKISATPDIFRLSRDIRTGALSPDQARELARASKSEALRAFILERVSTVELMKSSPDAIRKIAGDEAQKMKSAYEDAMKRAEVGRTPAGLSILGQKGVEELDGLERRLAIALQEGAGRKEIARLLQSLDEVNKKFGTSRQKLDELRASRGTRDFTEDQKAELGELEESFKFIDRRLEDFRRNAKNVRGAAIGQAIEGIDISFRKAAASAQVLIEEFRGSELTKQIADIDNKFTKVRETLEGVALRYAKLGDKTGLEAVKSILAQINAVNAEAVVIAEKRFAIEQKNFVLDQRRAAMAIQQQVIGLQRELRGGLENAFTSRFTDQADDRRATLRAQLIDAQIKIGEIDSKLLDPKLSEGSRAALESHKTALQELLGQTQENINATNAFALSTQSLWQGIGDTITGSLKDALKGWIKGTKDAEAVLLAFYDKITDAAIDYLFEITKIIGKQALVSSFGGSSGGFASLFGAAASVAGGGGFAMGGAFRGKIKAFANGGVIGGPTLFGLAGEAGKEGILPLDNVGGKLGVNASGLDGGVTVNFHGVIDAEAWFARNRGYVISTIQSARNSNRSGGI